MDAHSLAAMCALWQGGVQSSFDWQSHFFVWTSALSRAWNRPLVAVKAFSTKIAAPALSDTDLCLGMFKEGRWAERRGRKEATVSISKSHICVFPLLDHLGKTAHSPSLMMSWICNLTRGVVVGLETLAERWSTGSREVIPHRWWWNPWLVSFWDGFRDHKQCISVLFRGRKKSIWNCWSQSEENELRFY